jgi:hypothetical protein
VSPYLFHIAFPLQSLPKFPFRQFHILPCYFEYIQHVLLLPVMLQFFRLLQWWKTAILLQYLKYERPNKEDFRFFFSSERRVLGRVISTSNIYPFLFGEFSKNVLALNYLQKLYYFFSHKQIALLKRGLEIRAL